MGLWKRVKECLGRKPNGPDYVMTSETAISECAMERIRATWKKAYRSKLVVLEGGLKLARIDGVPIQHVGMDDEDAECDLYRELTRMDDG